MEQTVTSRSCPSRPARERGWKASDLLSLMLRPYAGLFMARCAIRTFDPVVKSGLVQRSEPLLGDELATPLDPVRRGRRGGEDAGYPSAVAAANGVQVHQVGITRNNEVRLAQVGDAGDVVVVRAGTARALRRNSFRSSGPISACIPSTSSGVACLQALLAIRRTPIRPRHRSVTHICNCAGGEILYVKYKSARLRVMSWESPRGE